MPMDVLIPVALWMLTFSVLAAMAIAWDKRQARLGRWRVRERTLHLFELLGGWPGSWLARHLLRHKTRDRRYRFMAAMIILLHMALWVTLAVVVFSGDRSG